MPAIRSTGGRGGLRHSVLVGTAEAKLARIWGQTIRLRCAGRCAGINHMAFYLELERKTADNLCVDLILNCWRPGDAGQQCRSPISSAMNAAGRTLCAMRYVQKRSRLWSPNHQSILPSTRRGLLNRDAKI